ncbi:MAG: molybdate ABC transporter substrate-binding protein [Pseudomonadota bacterium]
MIKNIAVWLIGILIVSMGFVANAEEKVTVFAAASLTNALTDIGAQYEKEKTTKIVHSFAASSTLAKQIENGAPADIFVSADTKWMNYLQDKKLIDTASRKEFLGNQLVLIAPKGHGFNVKLDKSFDFAKAFDGRLCTGDIDSVPAGIYAKQSLTYLNWWNGIKTRIVGAQDVRGALAFVERGECAAGIVYETDAKVSSKVEIIATFPENSHKPIVYPIAFVANAKNVNNDYFNYLQSPAALDIFKKYGFNILNQH